MSLTFGTEKNECIHFPSTPLRPALLPVRDPEARDAACSLCGRRSALGRVCACLQLCGSHLTAEQLFGFGGKCTPTSDFKLNDGSLLS